MAFREYHHIDASVYLKAAEDETRGDYRLTQNYIARLGRSYSCGISVVILGEIVKVVCERSKDMTTRNDILAGLGDFIRKQKIQIFSVFEDDMKLFFELRGLENRAHEPELLALATAIRKKANVFMTFDKALLESAPRFKSKYGIKVKEPI